MILYIGPLQVQLLVLVHVHVQLPLATLLAKVSWSFQDYFTRGIPMHTAAPHVPLESGAMGARFSL